MTTTALRKPIIKGKIESRAVVGMNQNINTKSDFSQILQQQKSARQNSAHAYKLSHQSAANLGYNLHDSQPGDARYKMISQLEESDENQNRVKVVFNKTTVNYKPNINVVSLEGKSFQNESEKVADKSSSGRLNPIQRRNQATTGTVTSAVSQSPRRTTENMLKKPRLQTLDVASSNGSLPKIPPGKQSLGQPASSRNELSLPQLDSKNQRNYQSQVVDAWPSGQDSDRQSINIKMSTVE